MISFIQYFFTHSAHAVNSQFRYSTRFRASSLVDASILNELNALLSARKQNHDFF